MGIKFWESVSQFPNKFAVQLKDALDSGYLVETDKRIGTKQVDLYIRNVVSGVNYLVEIKGRDEKSTLPPEIIPWLEDLKEKTQKELHTPAEKNQVIVVSLGKVNENVKEIFEENGIEIFDYSQHMNNPSAEFATWLKDIEARPATTK